MTLYQFKQLELNDQSQYTWDNGVLIGYREEGALYMTLYSLDSFYVEVQYGADEIINIKSFISDQPLEPYLDNINISDLLD